MSASPPDAMDSAPCPNCDRNQNGIFSERRDHRWHCLKCETTFDGPMSTRLRRYRREAAKHRLRRSLQETTTEPSRDGFWIEERDRKRERAFLDFEVVADGGTR
jgi:ribosomal protein L37AE/L43A